MTVMKKYEAYIKEEVEVCMDDCIDFDTIGDDEAYYSMMDSIVHELGEDDDLSVAIEKLIHAKVKKELAKRGVAYE
ncbi:MAG: hypothetical protein ACRC7S_16420 [Cetobacterium sp.]